MDVITTYRATAARVLLFASLACIVDASIDLSMQSAHAASKADRELGAGVFHEKGCEFCHGVDGVGTERAPDLSGVGKRLRPPEIEKQIRNGGAQMPAFGEALTDAEIQHLVAFLSAKKKTSKKVAQSTPAASK